MMFGLGSVVARRLLVTLAILMPLLVLAVQGWSWLGDREQALVRAREDAREIEMEVSDSYGATTSPAPLALYYREAARTIVHDADEARGRNACDWQRDNRIMLAFDAAGAPMRQPTQAGGVAYLGSSFGPISREQVAPFGDQALRPPGVSLPINGSAAPCLVDGTAIGVLLSFEGGHVAVMRLIAFDRAGFWELLAYAYATLFLFWIIAELVAWQFNRAINRRIGHITAVLGRVADSDFSVRVPLEGGPEFILLGTELNSMIGRLDLAQRVLSDLNSFVAHDLRSPVEVARVLLDGMQASLASPSPSLSDLRKQLDRINQTCLELLNRTKMDGESVDFASIIVSEVNDIAAYLALAREMPIDLDLVPAWTLVPKATLERIIGNLLNNATKFGAAGSMIRVKLTLDGAKLQLTISNECDAVPPDRLEAIFEKGESSGGYGLGLYAVRTAARLYGGEAIALPRFEGFCIQVSLPAKA